VADDRMAHCAYLRCGLWKELGRDCALPVVTQGVGS
jgi:hypothetical protein